MEAADLRDFGSHPGAGPRESGLRARTGVGGSLTRGLISSPSVFQGPRLVESVGLGLGLCILVWCEGLASQRPCQCEAVVRRVSLGMCVIPGHEEPECAAPWSVLCLPQACISEHERVDLGGAVMCISLCLCGWVSAYL